MVDNLFMTDTEKTFQFCDDLPSLPIPPLHHTLQRYLESVRPLVSDDEYEETVKIVDTFENGVGKELNLKLHETAKYKRNWLFKWWEDVAYLEFRKSLPINSHIAGLSPYFNDVWPVRPDKQTERAGMLLHYTLHFWSNIRRERLQPQKDSKGRPLCMFQFYKMYSTCRIPGLQKDELLHYFKTESEGEAPSNVIITYRGRLFNVECLDENGEVLTAPEFQQIIQNIYDMCKDEPTGQCISTLTADDRNSWAKVRNKIIALHPKNYETLEIIQKAIFVVGLSDDSPVDETDVAWRALCDNPENKWFDKSVSLVVYKNGLVCSGCDHSPCDAMVLVISTFYIHMKLRECDGKWNGSYKIRKLPAAEELTFYIDDQISQHIKTVREQFIKEGSNFEVSISHFQTYGRSYLKTIHLYPDTCVQLAIQYAYYKMYKRTAATYETASTRIFYHGRTETVRSCTIEAKDWCKAMVDPSTSSQTRVELLLCAVDKHNLLLKECSELKGCDRHLFGLYMVARENGLDIPDLFMDSSFSKSGGTGSFIISSSLTGYTTVFGGVAAMCENGYGMFYNIEENQMSFFLSTWKSSEETNNKEMVKTIHSCLNELKTLLDNHHASCARL